MQYSKQFNRQIAEAKTLFNAINAAIKFHQSQNHFHKLPRLFAIKNSLEQFINLINQQSIKEENYGIKI